MGSSGEENRTVLHGLHNSKSIQLPSTDRLLPLKTAPLCGPIFPVSGKRSAQEGFLCYSVQSPSSVLVPLQLCFAVSLLSAQDTQNYLGCLLSSAASRMRLPFSSCFLLLCGFHLVCSLPSPPHPLVLADQNIWVTLGRNLCLWETDLCHFIVCVTIL